MQYAIVDRSLCAATPGGRGECPNCNGEVIARCGFINVWHWAHASDADCDPWSEGESEWHRAWKRRFPRRWREFIMHPHRADVKAPQGVIELQASSISVDEIVAREAFYGEMVWLLDARVFNLKIRDRGGYVTFRWKHPRKTWWHCTKPLLFDLGTRLLRVQNIHPNLPCGGSGRFMSYEDFVGTFSRPKRGEQLCEGCKMPFPTWQLTRTGMYEFHTMDLDPETVLCSDCYEARRESYIPDDPDLYDAWTPLEFHAC